MTELERMKAARAAAFAAYHTARKAANAARDAYNVVDAAWNAARDAAFAAQEQEPTDD